MVLYNPPTPHTPCTIAPLTVGSSYGLSPSHIEDDTRTMNVLLVEFSPLIDSASITTSYVTPHIQPEHASTHPMVTRSKT